MHHRFFRSPRCRNRFSRPEADFVQGPDCRIGRAGWRRGARDFASEDVEFPGGGRGGGRRFGHGNLKLLLLSLIAEQPRHGYELIRVIEAMFHGHYAPSAGAVYPVLALLEDMGHAASREEGGRRLYSATDAGRAFLAERQHELDAIAARAGQAAREAARRDVPDSVRRAMHALKHALLMRDGAWPEDDAARVAAILDRAAAEIAAGFRSTTGQPDARA